MSMLLLAAAQKRDNTSYHFVTFTAGAGIVIDGDANQVVPHGADASAVTAVPNTGYRFINWTGSATSTNNPLTVTNVTESESIAANASNMYSVAFSAGDNGSVSGTTSQTVVYGSAASAITAVPTTGYHFVNWTAGGAAYSTANPLTISNVTADMAITANFAINVYNLRYFVDGSGVGGSLSGVTSQTIAHGGSASTVTATPSGIYYFSEWIRYSGTTDFNAYNNALTVTNVTSAADFYAQFKNTYRVIFYGSTGGSVTGGQSYEDVVIGQSLTRYAVAGAGYHFVNWTSAFAGGFTSTESTLVYTPTTPYAELTAHFAAN